MAPPHDLAEALRVMYGRAPDWTTCSPIDADVIQIHARDTASRWLVRPGRLTGTDPDDGTALDEACLDVVDDRGANADALLSGSAADLDCWLWRRPTICEPSANLTASPRKEALTWANTPDLAVPRSAGGRVGL